PLDKILDDWNRGRPPRGYRVEESDVLPIVRLMLRRCVGAGIPTLAVAPAHPPQTAADHPRTRRDAESVLEAARSETVPSVDAQALIDASGLAPSRAFVDYVHPSPEANALVGEALADALAPLLDSRLASRAPAAAKAVARLSVVDIQPRVVPVL